MYYYTKQFFVTFFLLSSIFLPVMGSSFPKTFLSDIIDPTKTFDDIKTKSLEECLPTVLVAFGCATESLQKDNVRLKRLCTEQERKLAAHAATIAQLQAEINQLKQARIVQQAEVETSRQDDFLEH